MKADKYNEHHTKYKEMLENLEKKKKSITASLGEYKKAIKDNKDSLELGNKIKGDLDNCIKVIGELKDAYKDDRLSDAYHLLVPTGFERNSFTIQVSLYKEPICGVSTLVKCWGWLPPYNGGMNDIHLCSANYVHQLQHALRLCGIDKEIIVC
jgi:hypothetical protein